MCKEIGGDCYDRGGGDKVVVSYYLLPIFAIIFYTNYLKGELCKFN